MLVACGMVACVPILAQDELPRIKVRGIALHGDGTPWTGASVHCRVLVRHGPYDSDASEELVVATDASGHFVVRALIGREHVLWAETALDDGAVQFSSTPVVTRLDARVELTMDATRSTPTRLRIDGLDAAPPPLRLRLSEPSLGRAAGPRGMGGAPARRPHGTSEATALRPRAA